MEASGSAVKANPDIRARIETLCETLVLARPDDFTQISEVADGFREISAWAAAADSPSVSAAASSAAALLDQITAGEAPHPAGALDVVNRTAAALQAMICEGRELEEVSFPEELQLGVGTSRAEGPRADAAPPEPEPSELAPEARRSPQHLKLDEELLDAFAQEAKEHLESIEANLLSMEGGAQGEDMVNAVFRAFHTIKGAAAFLNFGEIGRLAHEMENLLERARQGDLLLSDEGLDVTFAAVDLLKHRVELLRDCLKTGMPPPDHRVDVLIERVRALIAGQEPVAPGEVIELRKAEEPKGEGVSVPAAARLEMRAPDTIRVDAERLDRLLDTIGELVIAESMVSQSPDLNRVATADLDRQLRQLDKITRSLQEMSSSLRMIAIRPVFLRMARLVRDLAKKAGKRVNFITSGEDTEIDKAIVERIVDPLVHILRNAVDHGIEASAAARRAADKPETARIELRAFHRGGSIYVEVEDDGRGFDAERIRRHAVELGLLHPDERPEPLDLINLVFQPGFSTAEEVTDVSGRGVGLDVVRQVIENLRGQVHVDSEFGKKCLVSIRLPLSLAIIDGMIVRAGGERYVIPTLSVVRSLRPKAEDVETVVGRGEMLRNGKRLIPMFRLYKLFEIQDAAKSPDRGIVVIVEEGGRQVGLLADELVGQQQIVIKGMGNYLAGALGVAGGAIMPDGRVGLIIDVVGLVKLAHRAEAREVLRLEERIGVAGEP